MLSYVHHHNISGAWNIVFTALDNIEELKVSRNQKKYTTSRVKVMGMWVSQSVQLYTRPTMNMMSDLLLEMMRKKETTPINGM